MTAPRPRLTTRRFAIRILIVALAVAAGLTAPGLDLGSQQLLAQTAPSPALDSAERKIDFIAENGRREHPSTTPTVLTAPEWNAYLNQGGVKLPAGLSNIHISSEPGVVHSEADVDFDQLTANRTRNNPLLALFTGRHHVAAVARASAANGIASVHVQSVAFDGVEVPEFALDFFASRVLRPKYGNAIGMDSTFAVHNRIDTASVGLNQVTIVQR